MENKHTITLTDSELTMLHFVIDCSIASGIDEVTRAAALLHRVIQPQLTPRKPQMESMEIKSLFSQHFNRRK